MKPLTALSAEHLPSWLHWGLGLLASLTGRDQYLEEFQFSKWSRSGVLFPFCHYIIKHYRQVFNDLVLSVEEVFHLKLEVILVN